MRQEHYLQAQPKNQLLPIALVIDVEVQNRVVDLEKSAGDYLAKLSSFEELVARLHAVLRRQNRSEAKGRLNWLDTTNRRFTAQYGDT